MNLFFGKRYSLDIYFYIVIIYLNYYYMIFSFIVLYKYKALNYFTISKRQIRVIIFIFKKLYLMLH